jgi:hypothetical protein
MDGRNERAFKVLLLRVYRHMPVQAAFARKNLLTLRALRRSGTRVNQLVINHVLLANGARERFLSGVRAQMTHKVAT